MAKDARIQLIKEVEDLRKSRVLVMFMGDRGGLETKIASDLIPLIARHLRLMGKQERIDLIIYTLGGDVMAGYRTVHLLREYCTSSFSVIVPFRCQSTGTLIALGADRIVMLPEGQLSPVDPSTNGPYNPMVPGIPVQMGQPLPALPLSVEEVVSYFSLAKEVGGLKGEDQLVRVFEKLTTDVRPVALGQVYRARTQIRMLSRKLLQLHMKPEDPAIEGLVETLTEKLYSHDYVISRREAAGMGLSVEDADPALETVVAKLYDQYETDLKLREPFNQMGELAKAAGKPEVKLVEARALLESTSRSDGFVTEVVLKPHPQGVQTIPISEGWRSV
jgi:hypothetical protein